MSDKFKINILSADKDIEIAKEDNYLSLLEILKNNGYPIKSSCGGYANCSDCIVKILAGSENINQPTFEELQLLGTVFHITKERLSCQVKINGDFTVDIAEHLKDEVKKKGPAFIKVRKKDDVDKIIGERIEKFKEKAELLKDKNEKWFKYWEKDAGVDASKSKLRGGSKRPKGMKVDYINDERKENSPVSNELIRPVANIKKSSSSNTPVENQVPEQKNERSDFRKTRKKE